MARKSLVPVKTFTALVAPAVILLAAFLAIIYIASTGHSGGQPADILAEGGWINFAGAHRQGASIIIEPLDRRIVNQDGSGGQPNPPVNIRGPHLKTNGNFKLTAAISGVRAPGAAYLYLYDSVPVIYDEWRYEPPHLRIGITSNDVSLARWDGTSDAAATERSWTIKNINTKSLQIELVVNDQKLSIGINGVELGSMDGIAVFTSGNVWFGADAKHHAWSLDSLHAQSLNKGKLTVVAAPTINSIEVPSDALRKNAGRIKVGTALASYALFSDDKYRQLAASQFDMLTPENELKAQFIHPQPNTYSFTDADSLVDFAIANKMVVHGHNLVFGEANPKWMQASPLPQRQQIMTDHIKTVVSHFGSKINEWDVVDEPLADADNNYGDSRDLRNNIWLAAMGEDYIDLAFRAARTANPGATLYINEYGLEADGPRWQEFLSLINRLQARGAPVQGVGFQAHVYEPGDEIDTATLKKHIETLAGMGLVSRISEADVYGDSPEHQAAQYGAILRACVNEASCKSFTTWGITDRYGSTTQIHNYPLDYGNDLIWDTSYKPKRAYAAILAELGAQH